MEPGSFKTRRSLTGAALLCVASLVPAVPAGAETTVTFNTQMSPYGGHSVSFSEAVQGVTADNVVVRSDGGQAHPMAAHRCWNASFDAVDCAAGPVRSVSLTPAEPFVLGQRYTTAVNPEGAEPATASGEALAPASRSWDFFRRLEHYFPQFDWGWGSAKDPAGGRYVRERARGALAMFRVEGDGFRWVTVRGPNQGKAKITVTDADGVEELVRRVDNYRSTYRYAAKRRVDGLGAGTHQVTIEVLGKRRDAARGTWVSIHRVLGEGGAVPLDLRWASDAAAARSATKRATSQIRFRGSGVALTTVRGPRQGKARILIDGDVVGTVNDYRASTKKVTRRFEGLADGEHVLTVKVLGTRAKSSGGRWISVARVAALS